MKRKTGRTIVTEASPDEGATPEILSQLLEQPASSRSVAGLVVGVLCGRNDAGSPLVKLSGRDGAEPLAARSTVPLDQTVLGASVVLVFEHEDPNRPIIIGVIQPPTVEATVTVDDRETVIEGKDRIELRCGKAKIVLTSDGKVLIKGTDIVSRSEGPNRIKGASIQIN